MNSFHIDSPQQGADGWSCQVHVDPASPFFDGHFPQHPVLPGVAQMLLVERVLQECAGDRASIESFPQMRLRRQIAPDDRVEVHISAADATGQHSFRIARDGAPVTTGRILVGTAAQPEGRR